MAGWGDASRGFGQARSTHDGSSAPSPWEHLQPVMQAGELAFTARFGNASSRGHDLAIKLVPLGFEHSVRIHLLAPPGQEDRSVSDVLVWNTALRRLEWDNHAGLVGLGEHLDLALSLSSAGLAGFAGIATAIVDLLAALASPGVILIGSVGFVLTIVAAYYILLLTMAKLLLLYVCLPAAVLSVGCGIVKQLRLQRFEEIVLAAARCAIDRHLSQDD